MLSVLQEWVMHLPLREQGTLLTGVRGCDFAPKNPLTIDERYGCSTGEDTVERKLVAFLRYCILVPADPREIDVPGAWFQSRPPEKWKPSQLTHYPTHWFAHLMHCYEVIGYRHPMGHPKHAPDARMGDEKTPAMLAYDIYKRLASHLHLTPETREQMIERLSEDRIANGTVVS